MLRDEMGDRLLDYCNQRQIVRKKGQKFTRVDQDGKWVLGEKGWKAYDGFALLSQPATPQSLVQLSQGGVSVTGAICTVAVARASSRGPRTQEHHIRPGKLDLKIQKSTLQIPCYCSMSC